MSVPRGSVEASAIIAAREDWQKKQQAEIDGLKKETKTFKDKTA